jgi:multidrug efflux pump subunit AcrB
VLDIPIASARQEKTAAAMHRLFRPTPKAEPTARNGLNGHPVRVRNIATVRRDTAPTEVNHVNITRVTDVFANVEGRDIGSVAAEIEERLLGKEWPEGYFVEMRGEVQSMRESFGGLTFGFALTVVLIYFVMVALFRSFIDPLIVMLAVPRGLVGVLWILYATGTTLNVQSFMGTIFMIGIAQSNGTVLVAFANQFRERGMSVREAISEAAVMRLRPNRRKPMLSFFSTGGWERVSPLVPSSAAARFREAEGRGRRGGIVLESFARSA